MVDRRHLRPYWGLVDATALDQPKRVAATRRPLRELAKNDPDAVLTALAEIAALSVELAVEQIAERDQCCPSIARMEVLRTLGRQINGTAPLQRRPTTGPG